MYTLMCILVVITILYTPLYTYLFIYLFPRLFIYLFIILIRGKMLFSMIKYDKKNKENMGINTFLSKEYL